MKKFFLKYKWTIIYWVILIVLVSYFAPSQNRYYLDQDIRQFKSQYLIPALIWIFGVMVVGFFVYWIIKTKSVRGSLLPLLYLSMVFAFLIFAFQNVFLGLALFANRQVEKEKVTRVYTASFIPGTDQSKNNFSVFDPMTKKIQPDSKLTNELYRSGLTQSDTLILEMRKGLLGINFSKKAFKTE